MIPAFFPETLDLGGTKFDLSARALPLADAIRFGRVQAFAPDALTVEFLAVAYRKARSRMSRARVTVEELEESLSEFASLPITSVSVSAIAPIAFDITLRADISPADSWYVACAIFMDAELWISHDHEDGLVSKARSVHSCVYALTSTKFDG